MVGLADASTTSSCMQVDCQTPLTTIQQQVLLLPLLPPRHSCRP